MKNKVIVLYLLVSFLFSGRLVCAQEEDKSVDGTMTRMKIQLNLTQEQVTAVKPIVEEYVSRSKDLMQSPESTFMPDKRRVRSQMKQLKEEEDERLGHVLTPDQMKKWKQCESIKDFLNQDQMDDADKTPQHNGKRMGLGGDF